MNKETKNIFVKGMNWNTDPNLMDQSQYEWALNSVVSDKDGKQGGLISEQSNYYCLDIPVGYTVVGEVTAFREKTNENIVFITNNTDSKIIAIDNHLCTQRVIVEGSCLNFNTSYPVNALVKIKKNKDRIVYFTDDINNYRVVNIDSVAQYKDVSNNLVCDRILFSPPVEAMNINVSGVIEGGSLDMGTYKFYVRYISEDLATTNIIAESESVMIDKNSSTKPYMQIDGGYNLTADGEGASERYPKSSKAIQLTVSGLDQDFKYIQIEIVGYTAGSGATNYVARSEYLPIAGNVIKWTFTGYNAKEDIAIEDIIIDKPIIKKVKAHAQKDNRLFLAGTVETDNWKWERVQRAALNIRTSWRTRATFKFSKGSGVSDDYENPITSVQGNPKSNVLNKSFMRDEVYALGIMGILADGSTTPVFHIPGREKQQQPINRIDFSTTHSNLFPLINDFQAGYSWDDQHLTVDNNFSSPTGPSAAMVRLHEAKHVERYFTSGGVERWRVFNTGYMTSYDGLDYYGENAYYQTDNLYPNIDTPSGKLYGSLTGTPIRHHKMPDTNLVPHVDSRVTLGNGGYIYPLELTVQIDMFTGELSTTYPELMAKVKRWEIVSAERTEANKTVLDKGITTYDESDRGWQSSYTKGQHMDPDKVRFYSPKTLLKRQGLNGTHYKVEYYYDYLNSLGRLQTRQPDKNVWKRQFQGEIFIESYDYIGKVTDRYANNALKPRLSNFYMNSYTYISDATMIQQKETFVQGYPFNNAEGMRNYAYTPHIYSMHLLAGYGIMNPSNHLFDGGAYDPNDLGKQGYITYGAVKQEKSVYDTLEDLTYFKMPQYPINGNPNMIRYAGGDTFIVPMGMELTSFIDFKSNSGDQGVAKSFFYKWVESDLNMGMRHDKNTYNKADGDIYYKGWNTMDGTTDLFLPVVGDKPLVEYDYIQAGVGQGQPIGAEAEINSKTMDVRCFKQALLYNVDYSHYYGVRPKLPLSRFHDFFNTSSNNNYYRIRYSEKDVQDTIADLYRVMRPNNYVTQDAQLGEIIDLFVDKAELYSRTVKTIVHVPTNVQSVQTDGTSIYLGTGEVVPYEPRPIANVPYVYGGGSSFKDRLSTEFGTVFLDKSSRKIYLMRDGLKEISITMDPFFSHFLQSDLLKHGTPNPKERVILWYDTWKKRIMISARIFKFSQDTKTKLDTGDWRFGYDANIPLYFFDDDVNGLGNMFIGGYLLNGETEVGSYVDWTISYSMETESWTSFHSYTPDWAYATNRGFIGYYGNKVYMHQQENVTNHVSPQEYLMFNGISYPMEIEFNINEFPHVVKSLNHLNIYSEKQEWSTLQVYSTENKSHSGILNLIPQAQNNNPQSGDEYKTVITAKEGYFRVDNIRDKVIDTSLPIWQINDRRTKILNSANIATQTQMTQGLIRGNYISVRLSYMQTPQVKGKQILRMVTENVNLINR